MRANAWIMGGVFAIMLAISGAANAHDGNDCDKNGYSHGGEHPMSMLSDDQRQLLHNTMKKVFEQDKGVIEQMHKLHKDMHQVLAADTFDSRKFVAISAQMSKLRDKIHQDRVEAFASIAGRFTPQEREMIAKFHRHHHHHHHDGEGRDHSMNGAMAPSDQEYHPYPSR
jgi:Spy/CpxP family protein refolding chaperone